MRSGIEAATEMRFRRKNPVRTSSGVMATSQTGKRRKTHGGAGWSPRWSRSSRTMAP